MRNIVRIKFGSHLYGTDTPASDLDFKSVHIPSVDDILLQRVKGSVSQKRPKLDGEKNFAGEVDEESYSLQRFLQLASEGQTVSLDVLFAPEWAMTDEPGHEWLEILDNRHKLLTRKSGAFLGYCRQQANKYGIKGSRVSAARTALEFLDNLLKWEGSAAKLGKYDADIRKVAAGADHMEFIDQVQPGGGVVTYWQVCGRKLAYTMGVGMAHQTVAKLVADYGQRAIQAEKQDGVDWKALSHAVRVGQQALELLSTGHVTFPLPNAKQILDIKLGRVQYKDVARDIEDLLEQVERASLVSKLPDEPDRVWIDSFVRRTHRYEITS